MKLLIVTQVIDTEHPILGFFHRWVEEFAKHCEQVHVVCLQVGAHSLPQNVTVHSLGKESGVSKLGYLWRFYKYIWQLRHEYDNVFVHMNQIYVILGAPLWRVWGKRIGLWYTHGTVSSSLRLAEKLTHTIFTASAEGCQMKSDKIQITGHGIDTDHFAPDASVEKDIDLITVGRITESKNLLQLVGCLAAIRQSHDVSLTIVGIPVTDAEKQYEQKLQHHISTLGLTDHVHFIGRVNQQDLPAVLNRSKLFVTVAQNGSLDKVVLEAMSCALPVVSMAPGTVSLNLGDMQTIEESQFVSAAITLLASGVYSTQVNRSSIQNNHALTNLVQEKIITRLYG